MSGRHERPIHFFGLAHSCWLFWSILLSRGLSSAPHTFIGLPRRSLPVQACRRVGFFGTPRGAPRATVPGCSRAFFYFSVYTVLTAHSGRRVRSFFFGWPLTICSLCRWALLWWCSYWKGLALAPTS